MLRRLRERKHSRVGPPTLSSSDTEALTWKVYSASGLILQLVAIIIFREGIITNTVNLGWMVIVSVTVWDKSERYMHKDLQTNIMQTGQPTGDFFPVQSELLIIKSPVTLVHHTHYFGGRSRHIFTRGLKGDWLVLPSHWGYHLGKTTNEAGTSRNCFTVT